MLKLFHVPNKWLKHTCQVQGCVQGYVTIDRNEKIHRPKCTACNEYIASGASVPNLINCCSETPIFGKDHLKPEKYCKTLFFLNSEDKVPPMKLWKRDIGQFEVVQPIPTMAIRLPNLKAWIQKWMVQVNVAKKEKESKEIL